MLRSVNRFPILFLSRSQTQGSSGSGNMARRRQYDPYIPLGSILAAHDAKLRKGKWLVPYVSRLDNWESKFHDISTEGLFSAKKIARHPSPESLRLARLHLLRMRLEPAEVAAALLPAKLFKLVLTFMPEKVRRRLAEGRS
jgi:hypothetical protein